MRKNIFPAAFAAALFLIPACSRIETDQPVAVPEQTGTVLTVGFAEAAPGSETRTHMGSQEGTEIPVYWSDGDKVSCNGTASAALADLPEASTSAKFTFTPEVSTPYHVYYPADNVSALDYTKVTLPAQQTYKAGGFADNMNPMAGYSAGGAAIELYHLCAVVKLSLKKDTAELADADRIASVSFSGRDGEQVSGEFTVDYQAHTLTPKAAADRTDGDKTVEVMPSASIALSTDTAVEFYLAVPPGTYSQGFVVRVQDINGHYMEKKSTTSQTLAAGDVLTMPEFRFKPNATDAGITISNVQELIDFAIAYNNNDYGTAGGGTTGLVATLTGDIQFDASSIAAFEATGGIGNKIGDDTNYFNGSFNGKHNGVQKYIRGYTGKVPIFAQTGGGAYINDVVFDNTCDMVFPAGHADANCAPLVGRNKGSVKNCVMNGDIILRNVETIGHNYGGLVARNFGGVIEGCTMNGDIICDVSTAIAPGATSKDWARIGGIAGTLEDGGKITGCTFDGNITLHDDTDYGGVISNQAKTYVAIGGIVGKSLHSSGNTSVSRVTDCTAGAEGTTKTAEVHGVFSPQLSGIVANADANTAISGCKNYLPLTFKSAGGRTTVTATKLGGIAAISTAAISSCTNYGPLETVFDGTTIDIGGIVGSGSGTISSCTNETGGTLTRTNKTDGAGTNRSVAMGGIVGYADKACTITGCSNKAAILSNKPSKFLDALADLGGIVGRAEGQLTVSGNCSNSGNIKINGTGADVTHARNAVGGILGCGTAAGTSIKNATNSGAIECVFATNKVNQRRSHVGGIAGVIANYAHEAVESGGTTTETVTISGLADLEISGCTNTGKINSSNFNNSSSLNLAAFGGGIVGVIIGTADSNASVQGCTSSSPENADNIYNYRGFAGGIAGYAGYTLLKDDTSSSLINGNGNNGQGSGGIVAYLSDASLDNCTFSGTINTVQNIGGLVYLMENSAMIEDGCKADGVTLTSGASGTAAAVLVSDARTGVSIGSCGVKGTLDGAAITLSSNMITTRAADVTLDDPYLLP